MEDETLKQATECIFKQGIILPSRTELHKIAKYFALIWGFVVVSDAILFNRESKTNNKRLKSSTDYAQRKYKREWKCGYTWIIWYYNLKWDTIKIQGDDKSNQKVIKQKQSKISDYPKRDEQNLIIENLPIPHEVTIPKAKRQRMKNVSSEIVLDVSEEKQDGIPLVIDVKVTMNPELDKNDDVRLYCNYILF